MKSAARLTLFLLLFLVLPFTVMSQPHALLQDFSGYQQDRQLMLRWTFRSGSLCEGTRIERSADGHTFQQIGEVPGICGNPETAFTYTFTDSLPKTNAINHYRLELGNFGFTGVISVEHITTGTKGFVVLNTDTGHTKVFFKQVPGKKSDAVIYSSSGKRVLETTVEGNSLQIPPGRLAAGIYILMLSFADNTAVSGSFAIR